MVELKINLPGANAGYKISGVYKITFDDGKFYIGCSCFLQSRASSWSCLMQNPNKPMKKYATGDAIIQRIRAGGSATFDILELCHPDDLKDREAYYLDKNRGDSSMLSSSECYWKPVLQYTLAGNFIKKHMSTTGAAKFNGFGISKVQQVLSKDRVSYKGMVFIYEADYEQRRRGIIKQRAPQLPKKNKSIKINQCDAEGNIVATHDTYRGAGLAVRRSAASICRVLGGKQKTAGGYYWRYADAVPIIEP